MKNDVSENFDVLALTAEIVIAHVSHNRISGGEISGLIGSVYAALSCLGAPPEPVMDDAAKSVGAATIRKSLASPESIISMIDGKPYKMLKRHLAIHGLTPAQYRQRYGLKSDYPMVAPAYSKFRSAAAKSNGLGRKAGTKLTGAGKSSKPSVARKASRRQS
jgi:predicted transcriptional regulator